MRQIKELTGRFAVTGVLEPGDFAAMRAQGFDRIINFRPDGEVKGQPSQRELTDAAKAAGLRYDHLPVTKFDLFADTVVSRASDALAGGDRVLGTCASGVRAAIVWAAASARQRPVDEVLGALQRAQFDLAFIRDDLEAQADRSRWLRTSDERAAEAPAVPADLEAAA